MGEGEGEVSRERGHEENGGEKRQEGGGGCETMREMGVP